MHRSPELAHAPHDHDALLEASIALLPDAVVIASQEGTVVAVNDGFCTLSGFDRDALRGRMLPLLDGIPSPLGHEPHSGDELVDWIASVVLVCGDGAQRSALASFTRVELDDGVRVAYLISVPLDSVPVERILRSRTAREAAARGARRRARAAKVPVTSELDLAVERGEFFSRYQPIVSLGDGEIEAFEALLRWQHPRHGVVGPGAFLGEAESRGILAEITQQIVHDACIDAVHWNELRHGGDPISVSVNLCGSQLRDARLIASIGEALATSGLEPSRLWLEITENTGVTEATRDPGLLHDLRDLGVKLVLDDFGSGYASLGSVRKLPLDIVKLDRSLVSGAAENRCDARILAAGIEIAQALEIDVIAEGIERRVQLEYLQSLRCTSGQGYFFSRPVDRARADMLVAAGHSWLQQPATSGAGQDLTFFCQK
jgi:EAL domain-containing protein (putative c-di-GMP-specific phosphodiesterase class I)